jgi:enolase-phosphatase E1
VSDQGAALVLLDIEGTTTPVDFVVRVLFPDARARVEDFIAAHVADPPVARDLEALREEQALDESRGQGPLPWDGSTAAAAAYARWLMDQDRKTTALKSLQGRIWEEGYAAGRLRGQVYDDVPPALARWTGDGRRVAIFSSGSVLAQELLFRHSDHGDLTPFLTGYFDTTTGPKVAAESYRRIAASLGASPHSSLFVSDVVAELDAAQAAGFATTLAVRVPPGPAGHGHREVATFDALP